MKTGVPDMYSFVFKCDWKSKPVAKSNNLKRPSALITHESTAKISRVERSDLLHSNQLGAPSLSGANPSPNSIIDGVQFSWFRQFLYRYTSGSGALRKTQFENVCESEFAITGDLEPPGDSSSPFQAPPDRSDHNAAGCLFFNGVIAGDVKAIKREVIARDSKRPGRQSIDETPEAVSHSLTIHS
jgi:hypothetical protein